MCGIAGILRIHGRENDLDVVSGMLARLRHRGPDGEGLVQEGPLTLGHQRLAILDLSARARQPMRSASGRFLVSYNGEIYNFRDLREELGVRPQDLRSGSDTEVLLLAWERWGPAALDRMVGQFTFALYDTKERRLCLARDRFGEKPLFYHEGSGSLAFASSIPALLRAPWISREIDPEALAEFLTLRYVVSPRTVIAGVRKLPAGHLLSIDAAGVDLRRWYDPRFALGPGGNGSRRREEQVEEFGALLTQAARRCLISDVPVALLLSDGIDSNSIRSSLALAGHDVPCVRYLPVRAARPDTPVPARNGGGLDVVVSAQERFRQLVPAFSCFTEPVGDGAALALWLMIRAARAQATVFLCGSGGDEVLGGYRLDQDRLRLAAIHRFSWLPEPLLRRILVRHTFGAEPAAVRRLALRRAPGRLVPAVVRYLIHRPLPPGDLGELFGSRPVPGRYLEAVDRLYGQCAEGAGDLDRIQEVLLRTFLPEVVLSYADSAAMGSSAELRMPFLDRDLVAFGLRLPTPMRARRGPGLSGTKAILRLWARAHVRGRHVARRKRTFNYGSVRELLAENGGQVRDLVLGSRAVRRALPGIERWLGNLPQFFHGPREGTLWALLALGIWCEESGVL